MYEAGLIYKVHEVNIQVVFRHSNVYFDLLRKTNKLKGMKHIT